MDLKATHNRFLPPICLAAALVLSSCSVSRDIPEDSYLLNKIKVVTDGKYHDINPGSL